jgi:hypothetical protein
VAGEWEVKGGRGEFSKCSSSNRTDVFIAYDVLRREYGGENRDQCEKNDRGMEKTALQH